MTPRSVSQRFAALPWLACVTALVLATPADAIQITRICSDKIYIQAGTDNRGMYVGYEIVNDGATDLDDVWVTLDNFTGGVVTPSSGEDARYRIGTLVPGGAQQAYLYLKANGSSASSQTHDVNVRIGSPTSPPAGTETFSYIVEDSPEASPNKLTPIVSLPDGPVVGGILEVTVTGQTGPTGNPADLVLSPATHVDWPADVFELFFVSTQVRSQNDACTAIVLDVENELSLAFPEDGDYCSATLYRFRIHDNTPGATPISPIQYINSGVQVKHESVNCMAGSCDVPEITPAPPTPILLIDAARIAEATPTMTFRSDPVGGGQATDVHYRIEWDSDPSFASAVSASSDIDPGFENQDNPADTPPFQQGDRIGYTFQPQTDGTYWWRVAVRADDGPSWSGWTYERSVTINNVSAPTPPLADYHVSTEAQFLNLTLQNAAPNGDALVIANQAMQGTAQTALIPLQDLHTQPGTSFTRWKEVVVNADRPDAATSVSISVFDDNDVMLAGPVVGTGPDAGDITLDLSGHAEPEIYVKIIMTPGSTPQVNSITVQGDDAFTVPTFLRSFLARPMGTEVELSWEITTDGAPPRGFRMQRRSGNETFVDVAGLLPPDARILHDTAVLPGHTYTYRLAVVEADGTQSILAVTEVRVPAVSLSLGQNVPNPFNPSTRISFTTDRTAHVTLAIYSAAGARVTTLVDDTRPAGKWWAEWNGTNATGQAVASGVYYYQLRVDGRQRVRKMVMIR